MKLLNALVMDGPGQGAAMEMLQMTGLFASVTRYHSKLVPTNQLFGNDLLVLMGGEDIDPALYKGHKQPGHTYNRYRDEMELLMIDFASQDGVPILGICRGHQLLCAANGGKLIQDVGHHHGEHRVTIGNGAQFITNSIHHQMVIPDVNMEVLGWHVSNPMNSYLRFDPKGGKVSSIHLVNTGDEDDGDPFHDPEICYWPNHRHLGVQYHPEWLNHNSVGRKVTVQMIEQLVKGEYVSAIKAYEKVTDPSIYHYQE